MKKNDEKVKEKETMWNRNFIMVVLGQIISLFGNAILRFALPLYLLNHTGSSALFGIDQQGNDRLYERVPKGNRSTMRN